MKRKHLKFSFLYFKHFFNLNLFKFKYKRIRGLSEQIKYEKKIKF